MEEVGIKLGVVRKSLSLLDVVVIFYFSSWSLFITKALQHHFCSRTRINPVSRR